MIKLRYKLGMFSLLSKLVFGLGFILIMPVILERINLLHADNELIGKREQVIDIIAEWGVDLLMHEDGDDSFGSYNLLLEEYISLERVDLDDDWNFIEVTQRIVEGEIITYRVLNYSFLIDGEKYLLEIGKSLNSIRQTERNIRSVTLYFLLFFILASLLSDLLFASRLISPLEAITAELKHTTMPSLYHSIPLRTSTSEFLYLDKTLRQLMVKMDGLLQNEKQVTANISHELLTPISILRGKLENLLAHPGIDDNIAEKIEESLKTIFRLKTMVNSLLLIARLESHQYLKEEKFIVNDLLAEVIEELMPLAEDKEIKLLKEDHATINLKDVNRPLIFNMFYNVVNNAIKFTPGNGTIMISLMKIGITSYISIKDTGKGMDKAQMDSLFTRFKKKQAPDESGSGMGLAIAKSIADFHQINIQVKSSSEKGTEFIFFFRG